MNQVSYNSIQISLKGSPAETLQAKYSNNNIKSRKFNNNQLNEASKYTSKKHIDKIDD